MTKPHVLFLADTTHHTQAVLDHIQAITSSEQLNWHIVNPLTCKTINKLNLSLFDAIGIHYSIKPYNYYYLSKNLRHVIKQFGGVKFLFLQDEYQKVNLVQDYMYDLGFNLLFTLVSPSQVEKAYPDERLKSLKKITVLTGYVQDYMKEIAGPDIATRPIDVSYRGRRCEYWLGSLAHEKEWIATEFIKQVKHKSLRLDISNEEQDRVYGKDWIKLLQQSKAVLGTESGASIWDFDDSIRKKTNRFLAAHKAVEFDAVYEEVLKPFDGKITYSAISPRIFEAAATKTPMIMFPGDYSGICKAGIHFIELQKDFSNLNEVLEKLKDNNFLQELAENAYQDLIENEQYSQHYFSELIANQLLKEIEGNKGRRSFDEVAQHIAINRIKYRRINRLKCIKTELCFVLSQLFKLLLDPKHSFFEKISVLTNGFKRYLAYFLPRIKKTN